jgi:hypothetical protein
MPRPDRLAGDIEALFFLVMIWFSRHVIIAAISFLSPSFQQIAGSVAGDLLLEPHAINYHSLSAR